MPPVILNDSSEFPNGRRVVRRFTLSGVSTEQDARLADGVPKPGDPMDLPGCSNIVAAPYDDWDIKRAGEYSFSVRIPYNALKGGE